MPRFWTRFSGFRFLRTRSDGILPVVLTLAVLFAAAARADDLDDDDDRELVLGPSLIAKLQFVNYGILSGRIVAASSHTDASMTHNRVDPITGKRERVSIDLTTGLPNVRYEMSSPTEELTIEVVDADQLTVRHTAKDKSLHTVDFEQPRHGELVVTISDGSNHTVLRAASLWHLALAEPEACRTDVFPLLEVLRPSWHLTSAVGSMEESLGRWAVAHRPADRRVWQAWVESLGSAKFSERQAAERTLLQAGPAVLPFLESVDRDRMDAEQRSRLRDLVGRLDDAREDTIDRAVTWLAADPEVWLSLLSRSDEGRRRLATRQLEQLLGSPVEFDVAADPPTRAAQLARLRIRLSAPATSR